MPAPSVERDDAIDTAVQSVLVEVVPVVGIAGWLRPHWQFRRLSAQRDGLEG